MEKILLVTVGGSPQPIITSFRSLEPDRLVFICSEGPKSSISQVTGHGKPCEIRRGEKIIDRLPNFVSLFGLENKFDPENDIVLVAEDHQSDCYNKIFAKLKSLKSENIYLMADYTGGTKCMSIGLAMAGLDFGADLYITTGTRKDLVRITGGETTEPVSTALIDLDRKIEQFLPVFLKQYNYSAAIEQLEGLLRNLHLDPASKNRVRSLKDICIAFEAWDQFSHEEAWQSIESHLGRPEIKELGLYLKKILQSRADIDEEFDTAHGIRGHGFEIVEDLVMNAERRAAQKRYDDAVGRLYRALELLVQIHLSKEYEIKTGDADINKIPPAYRDEYEGLRFSNNDDKIMLGLKQAYLLLNKFENDPLGSLYSEVQHKIDDVLVKRNQSLFAHGFKPITAKDYQMLSTQVVDFMKSAVERLCVKGQKAQFLQFPDNFFEK